MKTNVSKSVLRREAKKETKKLNRSPFGVMNTINKNRDQEKIKRYLDFYGIKKVDLSMLLSFELGDGLPVFCKLKRLSDIETLDGNELKVVQIGKKYFEYVPIRFNEDDFFASLESLLQINQAKEKLEKAAKEKAAKKETKKAEKRESKINATLQALKIEFLDASEDMLQQIAGRIVDAA